MLNFPTTPKQPGLCSCCDLPVFEIIKKWPEGHPLFKEVRVVGKPTEDAFVLGMSTLSGATMEATFCRQCITDFEVLDIVGLWKRICLTNERELTPEYRAAIGSKPLTDDQVEEAKRFYMSSTPIGILYRASWRYKL